MVWGWEGTGRCGGGGGLGRCMIGREGGGGGGWAVGGQQGWGEGIHD